jgi:hypothetical protein
MKLSTPYYGKPAHYAAADWIRHNQLCFGEMFQDKLLTREEAEFFLFISTGFDGKGWHKPTKGPSTAVSIYDVPGYAGGADVMGMTKEQVEKRHDDITRRAMEYQNDRSDRRGPIVDLVYENVGKIFLPHEIAKISNRKFRNIEVIRELEMRKEFNQLSGVDVTVDVGGKVIDSKAYLVPIGSNKVGCGMYDGCPDGSELELNNQSTYSGIKILDINNKRLKEAALAYCQNIFQ